MYGVSGFVRKSWPQGRVKGSTAEYDIEIGGDVVVGSDEVLTPNSCSPVQRTGEMPYESDSGKPYSDGSEQLASR
ncbi:hypothetical protein [Nocardia donostiensis]|uniref:Uncharacterized protein n=1 Tax=Nocardia donostiensis TaxID=1538463 RepID=A0A1W0B7Y1_9NOCA|nr:hypothetical protein [Nocardia donostiensis]ONM48470.1 hypothetical protein B0T46_12265 [Nocardia donostiensis]OQS16142.1 hypothetical protein B0T36_04940 [Nocardia donostiensis]OQS18617.1 hypothetical protein B0T44_18680 [Nocardia donostiensis]